MENSWEGLSKEMEYTLWWLLEPIKPFQLRSILYSQSRVITDYLFLFFFSKMKVNYICCIGLSIFRLIDIILTAIIISLGGCELNPLGFNIGSIALVMVFILGMWFLSYYIKEEEPYQSILFLILIVFISISAVVDGYSCRLLFNYYL